jgi:hypothetical protein
MEIVLSSIGSKGDLANERIGFKVLKDCELKYYLVFKTVKMDKGFFNRSPAAYWFLPQELKVGDSVVLYSKAGQDSVNSNGDGSKTYFFYWGLTAPIFNMPENCVVLASLKTWKIIS